MRSNHDLLLLLGVSMLAAGCASVPLPRAAATAPREVPTIRFYEGWNASQENICTVSIDRIPFYAMTDVKAWGCDNDEAKSMKLRNLPAGSVIELYDDPGCGDHDDWVKITVLKARPGADDLIVGGFEGTGTWEGSGPEPNSYRSEFHPDAGRHALHGKVSCARIDIPGPHRAKVRRPA